MDMLDDVEFKVAKLELQKDDFLVVRPVRPITSVMAAELRARIDRQCDLKGRVLVIGDGVELSVVSKAEAKKLLA